MAKGHITVKEDRRKWDALQARMLKLGEAHVKVGILGTARAGGDSITNVELGVIHEFGAPSRGIPERRPLRAGLEKGDAARRVLTRKLVGGIYDGKIQPDRALHLLGMRAVADIKSNILSGPGLSPPNAPATVARKRRFGGTAEPRVLVDTGQLVNSYTYALVPGGA